MKRKWLLTILVIVILTAGLSLLLYPTVANYFNSLIQRQAISDYRSEVDEMEEADYEALLAAARDYNRRLAEKPEYVQALSEEEAEEYYSLLDVTGSGLMGYITIPKISAYLPIYHGTSDAVLQVGVGHLEFTSLPVGGESTHTVLSGHRGLPASRIFTDLDRLAVGDTFSITVLKETLTYEVDQILVVYPYEVEDLRIAAGEDLCTLITCTPYGVNTHRMMVRGHRIPTPESSGTSGVIGSIMDEMAAGYLPDFKTVILIVVAGALLLSLIIVLPVSFFLGRKRQKETPKEAAGDPSDGTPKDEPEE